MYIIVAGTGIIGEHIVRDLLAQGHDVVAIEKNEQVCQNLSSEMGVMVIQGDATDLKILARAGADHADVLVCCMHFDSDNIACSLLARSLGVPRIVGRLRNPIYEQAYLHAGMTAVVNIADIQAIHILAQVDPQRPASLVKIANGQAELVSIPISPQSPFAGKTVEMLYTDGMLPQPCAFTGIFKSATGQFFLDGSTLRIEPGDVLSFVVQSGQVQTLADKSSPGPLRRIIASLTGSGRTAATKKANRLKDDQSRDIIS